MQGRGDRVGHVARACWPGCARTCNGKVAEVHAGQPLVALSVKVVVEPERLLYLKADPLKGRELLRRDIHNEPAAWNAARAEWEREKAWSGCVSRVRLEQAGRYGPAQTMEAGLGRAAQRERGLCSLSLSLSYSFQRAQSDFS